MPYYKDGNIAQFVERQGPLQPAQRNRGIYQLLQGIQYLHEGLGIAHRDIKPQNNLVASTDPLHIVLSDFGLAKVAAELMKTQCGTYWYWAPDLFQSKDETPDLSKNKVPGYQVAVDIWSAGVVMYEWMYHGLPKHDDYDIKSAGVWTWGWARLLASAVENHCSTSTKSSEEFAALDLLKRMLVIDVKDRYTAEQCLKAGEESGLFEPPGPGSQIIDGDAGLETDSEDLQTNGTFLSEASTRRTALSPAAVKRIQSIKQASYNRLMQISGHILLEKEKEKELAQVGTLFETTPPNADDRPVEDDAADSSFDIEEPQDPDEARPQSANFLLTDRAKIPPKVPKVKIEYLADSRFPPDNIPLLNGNFEAAAIETPRTAQHPTLDEDFPGVQDSVLWYDTACDEE